MRVASAHASQQRRQQTQKGIKRIAAESAEQQVEPHHIGLQLSQHLQKPKHRSRVVERPATYDGKTFQFRLASRDPVGKNGDAEKRIPGQFLGNVQAVFAQSALAGWKSGYQTNFHSLSGLQIRPVFDVLDTTDVGL